ncbi:arsenite efflux MFS transporter ArsK [Alsobacter sp. R-9]
MTTRPGVPGPATVVWLLGLTQIVGYGSLYYAFGILAADIAADLGWPVSWVFGAFSLTLLAGGLVAPRAGRLIDRHGAPVVMAAGSTFAAAAMVALALAPGPVGFVLGLAAVQVSTTFVTYDAAFACIVQVAGLSASRRIVHLTLIAGFASTLFWPLTAWLHGFADWRTIVMGYAVLNLVVCLPAHAWLRRAVTHAQPAAVQGVGSPGAARAPAPLPKALQRRAMVAVAVGFALGGFVLSAILAQMVPLLSAMNLGDASVAVSMLFGPSQVLVRFANMRFADDRHPVVPTLVSAALLPVAVLILAGGGASVAAACVFAVVLGAGSGLKSIVQGTLPLALFGRAAYGERLGRIASVRLVLSALAPFVLAAMLETTGPVAALIGLAIVGVGGTLAFVWVVLALRSVPSEGGEG